MDLDIAASSSPLSIHAARPLGGIITPALAPASTPGLITNHYTNANANANASAQGYGQPSPNYHYVPNGMMNHHQHIPNGHGPGHGPANGVTPRGRGGGRGSRGGGRGRPPSVQRQVTASSYTNGNVNGSPSSTGSSSDNHLPPNQIHIVQSNPQRITHYPPSATAGLQQQQHLINGYGYGDRFALPNGTTTGPSPYPVVDGPTAARSTLPFGADSSYSPLANGSGIRRMIEFVESLSGMQCGTIEEWETFVEEQFEDESRFHLTLTGQDLKMYDIPTAFLPRFFVTLQECGLETHNLVLLDPIESRISTSSPGGSGLSLLVECEEIEWRTDHQTTWKGSLIAEIGSSSSSSSTDKIDNLEMEFDCSEYEIPDRVLRVLEMSQQMENMMLVMEVAEEEKLSPSEALESLVERSSDTQTP